MTRIPANKDNKMIFMLKVKMKINSGNVYYPFHYVMILVLRYVVTNISWETAASIPQGRSDCGRNAVGLYMEGDMESSYQDLGGGWRGFICKGQ
jgi:hypothetical protein